MNVCVPLIADWPETWAERLAQDRPVTLGHFSVHELDAAGVSSDDPTRRPQRRRERPPAPTPPAEGWNADPLALVLAADRHYRLAVFGGLGPHPKTVPDVPNPTPETLGLDTVTLNCIDGPDGRPVAVLRRRHSSDIEVSLVGLQTGIASLLSEAFPASGSGDGDRVDDSGYGLLLTFFWHRRALLREKAYTAEAEIIRLEGRAEAILQQHPALDADADGEAAADRVDLSEATRRIAAQVDVVWRQATAA
jgi:hypothetical protein